MSSPLDGVTRVPDFHPEDPTPITGPGLPPPIFDGKLKIPDHWGKMWGVDFGITHPFGAVLCAWDRDCDVFYVLKTVKISDAIPEVHIAAMNHINSNAPVAWPHDGEARERSTNETLAKAYRDAGLKHMLDRCACFSDGGYSTEAAVHEMDQRMRTGRFRVCEDLHDWWFEYRLYHREKGLIVKVDDDLLSATQKVIMMKRYMRNGPIGYTPRKWGVEDPRLMPWDLFTGRPFA